MRNRLMRFVVCALAWLAALVLLVPVSLAEEDGGTLDNIEWRFADGVMTLKGDGILTGPNRPWDAYKPETRELIIGSTFPDHRDWSGYAGLKALKKVTFETDYCSACFSDSKDLNEVRYTGAHPVFMGMAFIACRLDEIVFDSPEADYVLDGNLLMNRAGTEVFYCLGSKKTGDVVIPEGVEVIHEGAFAQCSMRSITLPSTLRVIEGFAFFGVKQLQEITIPAGCREIGASAFAAVPKFMTVGTGSTGGACKGLQTIVVPGCGEAPFGLLRNCRGLRRIEFAEGTTKIGSCSGVFENCDKVTVLILPDEIEFDGSILREMKNPIIWCHEGTPTAEKVERFKLKHKFIERE